MGNACFSHRFRAYLFYGLSSLREIGSCASAMSKMCSRCGNKQAMPLYKRTYCCVTCGLVMDRDENSAINILQRYLARLGPHMERISMRCAGVFTAIDNVTTVEHI